MDKGGEKVERGYPGPTRGTCYRYHCYYYYLMAVFPGEPGSASSTSSHPVPKCTLAASHAAPLASHGE